MGKNATPSRPLHRKPTAASDDEGDDDAEQQRHQRKKQSTFQDYDGSGSKVQHTRDGDLVMRANHGGGGRAFIITFYFILRFTEAVRPELYRLDFITAMKVIDDADTAHKVPIQDNWRNEWNRGVQVDG